MQKIGLRIGLFTNGIWPLQVGGMQKHSYYLAKYLAKNKVSVDIYIPTVNGKGEDILVPYFLKDELKYIDFKFITIDNQLKFPGHYIYDSWRASKNYYKEFNREVDLIYIQGFSGWYFLKKKKIEKIDIPTIINFHGLEMFQQIPSVKGKLINFYFRQFVIRNLKLADYVQSLGGKLAKILRDNKIAHSKIIELGIGIDNSWLVESTKVKQNKQREFVFLGRYERRKGIVELINVLRDVEDNFLFHFIGPIPPEEKWISDNIIYHDLIHEKSYIQKVLNNADILVCPSYSEGMPTVILEAMASGCAIIATDVGAVSEQVSEKNGWLIPPGDKIALKEAILDAINCPNSILSLKQYKSIQLVKENFLWEKVIEDHIEAFKKIACSNEIS